MAHGRCAERVPIALGLSRVHSRLQGRVRRREARVRVQMVGMVQRSNGLLSFRRAASDRAGHRLERAPARRQRAHRVFHARGGRRRPRSHRPGLRDARPSRSRARARFLRCLAGIAAAAGGSVRVTPLRIALVGPVSTSIPPTHSGSIETMTALLTDGLVARGHDVTLFATGASSTKAKLHAVYPRGYGEDTSLWPWELCELFNLAAAVERAGSFDVIHCQAEYYPMSLAYTRVSPTPILQTLHHSPSPAEVAHWSRYPDAPFVAVSEAQSRLLSGLNVVATVHHAVDTERFVFRADPDDYLLFLGRFTEGKGVLPAIEAARRTGMRLILAAAENEYYRDVVAPLVDQHAIVYVGEVDRAAAAALLGGARALLYPVQEAEPFGLVLVEAAACGTPVGALDRGAVREIVDEGITGCVFESLDALVDGLPRVLALDRRRVRARAVDRFGIDRMVDAYVDVYSRLIAEHRDRKRILPLPLSRVASHRDKPAVPGRSVLRRTGRRTR